MFLPGITAWCMDMKPAAIEKKIRTLMRTPLPRELIWFSQHSLLDYAHSIPKPMPCSFPFSFPLSTILFLFIRDFEPNCNVMIYRTCLQTVISSFTYSLMHHTMHHTTLRCKICGLLWFRWHITSRFIITVVAAASSPCQASATTRQRIFSLINDFAAR